MPIFIDRPFENPYPPASSVLNFNFLTLPGAGCATPNVSFYKRFNGVTLGVTAFLAYIGVCWAIGIAIMRWRCWPQALAHPSQA